VDSVDLWCFEDASDVDFYFLFYDARESGNRFFLSLKVGCKGGRVPAQLAQYDFESYWTFRVKIERKRDEAGIRHFTIERHGDSEYPDYEWRRKAFPAKYA
jgi:hypothetical protein